MSAFSLAVGATVRGQEAPRSSLARQRKPPVLPTDCNIKAGQVYLRFDSRWREEFVDNINLSSGTVAPIESDFITTPELRIDATWHLTKLNSLHFNTAISYSKYLTHSELDTKTLLLAPDSELTFNIFVGDFKFQFHDRFSLQEDPVAEGTLSNVAKFGQFTNTIGGSLLWDLNDVKMSLGYDHSNFLAIGATGANGTTNNNLEPLNRSTEQISAFVIAELSSSLATGVEGTASTTRYPLAPENDDKRITVGPFASTQLTRYTKLDVALGYQVFYSEAGNADMDRPPEVDPLLPLKNRRATEVISRSSRMGNSDSYYATVRIEHRLNRFYKDILSIGHENQAGLFGQETQTDYLRYFSTWQVNAMTVLESSCFYEAVRESGMSAAAPFNRFGANFNLRYQVTRRFNMSLYYGYIQKTSQNEDFSYRQNRLGLLLNYRF